MAKKGEKRKRRWWLPVIIVIVALVVVLGINKMKSSRTDADLILAISEQGFEGHFYDAGERDKAVITFSGSEGGSSASDTMAWYYKQHGMRSGTPVGRSGACKSAWRRREAAAGVRL